VEFLLRSCILYENKNFSTKNCGIYTKIVEFTQKIEMLI